MSGLVWELSTQEEMDAVILKIADLVSKYQAESAAVLVLESIKPLTPVGGGLARVFVSPWLHFLGINTRHVVNTLEEPKNVEKLIKTLEEREKEKQARKKRGDQATAPPDTQGEDKPQRKTGWRRLFPF